MFITAILAGSVVLLAASVLFLVRKVRKQEDYLQSIYLLLQWSNDAQEMILWKTRYDIVRLEKACVETENYEMAQEVKKVATIIEGMINYYRTNLKG